MSKILMVASEAMPFAKTGGLADVIGALSPTLRRYGDEVAIVMPRYRVVKPDSARRIYDDLRVWLGSASYGANIYCAVDRDVPYYLVDCPVLYDRDGLYGTNSEDYPDNHVRYAVLCQAALTICRYIFRPDVIHCHDWQSALMPVYLKAKFAADPTFIGMKTLFTIHNMGYAGLFPKEALAEVGLDSSLFTIDGLEFYGKVNLMKGALIFADAISTVSPTYALEIQTPELGFGLDGLLRKRSDVLTGILNGVDYTNWDPATDKNLAANYSPADLSGKAECKRDLLREFGLAEDAAHRPLIGIVSRFVGQKGFDLIQEIAADLMNRDLSLVALGTGDPEYEQMFRDLAAAHPDKVGVRIAYDDALAHRIEGGSDMFLMPSRYEPCGLNQMYSLKYGTVPVVRATGGLNDTIDESTGFKFVDYTGAALLDAVAAALDTYRDGARWRSMMLAGMAKDFSWNASARQYSDLYRAIRSRKI